MIDSLFLEAASRGASVTVERSEEGGYWITVRKGEKWHASKLLMGPEWREDLANALARSVEEVNRE